jgi:hypothetical protein
MTDLVGAPPAALPTVERWTPPPADRDPRRVYLAGLAPSSKGVVARRLRQVARMFTLTDEHFPWSALRYTHVVALRQRLVAQDLRCGTRSLEPGVHDCRGLQLIKNVWAFFITSNSD